MIGIEDLDAKDLREVAAFYVRLAERAKRAGGGKETHSIDEEGMPSDTPHLAKESARGKSAASAGKVVLSQR